MPPLNDAYAAALQAPPQPTAPAQTAPAMPAGAVAAPRTPVDSLPMTQQADTFFLDPSMLPEGMECKEGDELLLKTKVGKPGSKIPLTPIEVVMEGEGPEEEASESAGGEEEEYS